MTSKFSNSSNFSSMRNNSYLINSKRKGRETNVHRQIKVRARQLNQKSDYMRHFSRHDSARQDESSLRSNPQIKHCLFFSRFGYCRLEGKCHYIHDTSKVIVCRKYLGGMCTNPNCLLNHTLDAVTLCTNQYYCETYSFLSPFCYCCRMQCQIVNFFLKISV